MNTDQLREAVIRIMQTSQSEDEIRERIRNDLGYPHEVSVFSDGETGDRTNTVPFFDRTGAHYQAFTIELAAGPMGMPLRI